MTLLEMKKKVLALIEETGTGNNLTDDPDIEGKINDVINHIQFELARIRKIPAIYPLEVVEDGLEYDLKELDGFYQLDSCVFKDMHGEEKETDIFGTMIDFPAPGTCKIKYFKMPAKITAETEDSYTFELPDDALEVLPYGVAADLLKSDVSNNYGSIYAERYESMKQLLDPRYTLGLIYIEGGI